MTRLTRRSLLATGLLAGEGLDLASCSGDYNHDFIGALLPHHRSAVEMATEAQTKATHAGIKQLASTIIAARQREIDRMMNWRAVVSGPVSR